MTIGIDPEGLFAVYADWIAFLREKRTTFEGQLVKLQAKTKGQEVDTPLPVSPQSIASSRNEKKTKTPAAAPVLAGASALSDKSSLAVAIPLPEPENEALTDEKAEEIPEWLWQAEPASLTETDKEETPSSVLEEEDIDMDDWM